MSFSGTPLFWHLPVTTPAHWELVTGYDAAIGESRHSTDEVRLFPADVRDAGLRTYELLVQFRQKWPNAFPGPNGTRTSTAIPGSVPETDKAVKDYLEGKYKGDNGDGKNVVDFTP